MSRVLFAVLAIALAVSANLPSVSNAQGLNGILTSVDTMDKNFDIADTNHDGVLSKDEAMKGNVPFIVMHFDAIDTQHRGLVSKQDVHAYIVRMLEQHQPTAASSSKPG
jgi:hypothetical protein